MSDKMRSFFQEQQAIKPKIGHYIQFTITCTLSESTGSVIIIWRQSHISCTNAGKETQSEMNFLS